MVHSTSSIHVITSSIHVIYTWCDIISCVMIPCVMIPHHLYIFIYTSCDMIPCAESTCYTYERSVSQHKCAQSSALQKWFSCKVHGIRKFFLVQVSLLIATHHAATHCNTLQHTATHCNTLQYIDKHNPQCTRECGAVWCSVLQCVAMCCSVLQCVAVCCHVLQCVAMCCSVLPCVAVCCNVS